LCTVCNVCLPEKDRFCFPPKPTDDSLNIIDPLSPGANSGDPDPEEQEDKLNIIDPVKRLKKDGMEFLGLYCPDAVKITLFISRSIWAAEALKVNTRQLIEVVLIHEAAHYLTHLGIPIPKNTSPAETEFGEENQDLIEEIAQSGTYFYLQAGVDHAKLHCFEILSLYQPSPYTTWGRWKRLQTQGRSFWQCLGQFQRIFGKRIFTHIPILKKTPVIG
jgi:hypothetical protein